MSNLGDDPTVEIPIPTWPEPEHDDEVADKPRSVFWREVWRIQPVGIVLGILASVFSLNLGAFLFTWLVFFLPLSIVYTALFLPVRQFGDDLRRR